MSHTDEKDFETDKVSLLSEELEQTNMKAQDSMTRKYLEITGVIALYWVVSISIVMLNKQLLGGRGMEGGLDAPCFITWFQAVWSIFVIRICGRYSWAGGSGRLDLSCDAKSLKSIFFELLFSVIRRMLSLTNLIASITRFTENDLRLPKIFRVVICMSLKIRSDFVSQILPLSIVFVGMVTSNNLCIKFVGVAFYYVNRSLTTVFNVILSYVFLSQTHSKYALFWCVIILVGFFIGVDQETASGLSLLGVIPGVLASLLVALNAILTKKYLACVDGSILRLGYLNNVNAAIIFIPLILLSGEVKVLMSFKDLNTVYFWTVMSISGVLGFAVGTASALQIKVTSPLTHNVSGTAKASAQTILAVLYYEEFKTAVWWTSNFVVLLGSMGYTRAKQLEMEEGKKKQNQSKDIEKC
ncbi:unnamed protein product [Notodromas monacha]|uniref:Sugar phosphate transporter domain-containing protein n=1 Tax=Notodromas monacha TaxID=399045 RepID=A0A7R9GE98_9CRUS|nr:unnamed protein product [Notodromas monacha]CAG0918036.1 unnamed protein product [Notodromas monacha]